MLVLLMVVGAQEPEEDVVVPSDAMKPLVFPDAMQAVAGGLTDGMDQTTWLASIAAFLGNNSTNCLNFTAPVSA